MKENDNPSSIPSHGKGLRWEISGCLHGQRNTETVCSPTVNHHTASHTEESWILPLSRANSAVDCRKQQARNRNQLQNSNGSILYYLIPHHGHISRLLSFSEYDESSPELECLKTQSEERWSSWHHKWRWHASCSPGRKPRQLDQRHQRKSNQIFLCLRSTNTFASQSFLVA